MEFENWDFCDAQRKKENNRRYLVTQQWNQDCEHEKYYKYLRIF